MEEFRWGEWITLRLVIISSSSTEISSFSAVKKYANGLFSNTAKHFIFFYISQCPIKYKLFFYILYIKVFFPFTSIS